jgi:hypothetical protein
MSNDVQQLATIDLTLLPDSVYDFITSYMGCMAGSFHELDRVLAHAGSIGSREPKNAGLRERLEADLRAKDIDPTTYMLILVWK